MLRIANKVTVSRFVVTEFDLVDGERVVLMFKKGELETSLMATVYRHGTPDKLTLETSQGIAYLYAEGVAVMFDNRVAKVRKPGWEDIAIKSLGRQGSSKTQKLLEECGWTKMPLELHIMTCIHPNGMPVGAFGDAQRMGLIDKSVWDIIGCVGHKEYR